MAKEKFMIVATPMLPDMFGRFSETDNIEAINNGTVNQDDPYAWIEGTFEIHLIRHREATYMCSFTPSAYAIWLANEFVGVPNEAWEHDGDPEGLEFESGGQSHDYITYRDEYDSRFICETFTIDTMRDLDEPMRKPRAYNKSLSRRDDRDLERLDAYGRAIWEKAEEWAHELMSNGAGQQAPILNVYEFRRWEKEKISKVRQESLDRSSRLG